MNKCKRIVTFFKSSTIATEKFKIAQAVSMPYTLIQEVPTRWNSAFFIMERIIKTHDAISYVLVNTAKAPQPFSIEEIEILKELCAIMSLFNDASKQASADKIAVVSKNEFNKVLFKSGSGCS